MKRSAARIKAQAAAMGVFDTIVVADERALAEEELKPWRHILQPHVRGFGYWCWKPYLIEKTLRTLNPGDILLYCDAGTHLNPEGLPRFREYLHLLDESPLGVLAFDACQHEQAPYLERQWNKGDTLRYFGCESRPDIADSPQVAATQIFLRYCPQALTFVKDWNAAWQHDFHLIDDSPSQTENATDFCQHRHDQSLFSLLYKLRGGVLLPWWEKYARDWDSLRAYPLWTMRDKGHRIRPLLRLFLYLLGGWCPIPSVRKRYSDLAAAYLKRRPYLREYLSIRKGKKR